MSGLSAVLTVTGSGVATRSVVAQPAAIQTQDSNFPGVTAELTECRRSDGVLNIRVRLRNTGGQETQLTLLRDRRYDDFYVTAANKKYFVLRDAAKTPLAPAADAGGSLYATVPKGGVFTWWAKYPAPPPDVKKVNYVTPFAPPFEDVPITD
jgi:hypothetical protein